MNWPFLKGMENVSEQLSDFCNFPEKYIQTTSNSLLQFSYISRISFECKENLTYGGLNACLDCTMTYLKENLQFLGTYLSQHCENLLQVYTINVVLEGDKSHQHCSHNVSCCLG